jgi:signal peptide peptidase-like 2B
LIDFFFSFSCPLQIYNIVKVMYAVGCSNAVIQVITFPLLSRIFNSTYFRGVCFRERILYKSDDIGDITNWDVVSALVAYTWGMTWLYMALFVPHADTNTFFWVTQDVMGACMCITFLGLIQLNNIQVATILLLVAFVYDIFFVFVTPFLFHGKSVMITVATSGGPPEKDAMFCEKYPSDPGCRGGDPLPMLLTVPRLLDYQGGASMLGLGDIVLPGLLLSFAARLDAAKCLVAIVSGAKGDDDNNNNSAGGGNSPDAIFRRSNHVWSITSSSSSSWWCCLCSWISYYCCGGGGSDQDDGTPLFTAWYTLLLGGGGYYFVPLVIAYAVGLIMANIAVYVMEMGQPALLYLVPCTLGTMTYLGWKRQELRSLWDGPKIIATADDIVLGREATDTTNRVTTECQSNPIGDNTDNNNNNNNNNCDDNRNVASRLESGENEEEYIDDETGDVPLLSTNAGVTSRRGEEGSGSD